jgi:hypothetical protein
MEGPMKSEAGTFGFDVLLTFLLPGFIVTIGVLLLHAVNAAESNELLKVAGSAQFLTTFVLLAVVTLFGVMVAAFQAIAETYVLDRLTPYLASQTKIEFDNNWQNYVLNLPKFSNRYISRVVLFFQFETRLGLSLLFLGLVIWHVQPVFLTGRHALASILLGVALYMIGELHHVELAKYRAGLVQANPNADIA